MIMAESTNKSNNDKVKCKILIVGAGMAGLSAANHLLKNHETDFLIVEARGRIGGRIVSLKIGNEKVELGANWIHGVLGNPMFELAMANGLIDIVRIPRPHKVVAATEDGKQLPFPVLQEIYEAYVCFLRRCEEYFLSPYSPPDGINSVGAHVALEAEIYLSSLPKEDRRIRQLLFDCLLKRETCITGCDSMEDVDLLEMGSYAELQGGNISLPDGYSAILEPVAKHIPKDSILTRHVVTKIRWQRKKCAEDENSTNNCPNKNTFIEIECENGKTILAEHVICTLPLGVLKEKANDIFDPPLPTYKLDAIDRLLFGTVDKIFLEYERPFLNPGISEVMLLWDDRGLTEEEKQDVSKTWFRKIYSFTKVSETLLLGWISGKAAEYMERLSSAEVADVCTSILRKFLNDPFVPAPNNCIHTSWHMQPYTHGSYTAMAVGASQLDINCLAEPIKQEDDPSKIVIAFAGEHTHTSFYSTVHGAYLTGRTAAQTLLESRKNEKNSISLSCEDTSDLSSWIQGISLN
ncbi:peroxisomal N(1)-acetyl-spermine/spermidine oxidase [Hylaeus anthracinus]|uniref:peroxisomal N(1)-acetyl-spermine/spermidine oxidase n=1 Tax=Hylaeus volcanicus TaxID=313075 RepID=UPI0023B84AEA|nr:peroxisomal N(1)-acetyl-spermine/spermidine oxidase [Hylaeus volcanicus]XP_053983910.1 peroxisomal N(1)-acetyl-spermine/spermidine oxidase [Hylaeus volcanicus]XP_053983911.1 peroxisomal N(1)-acetyl-spermine/spermidine oxidase [Hylaeus volcanicus]XP_053998473.1 peroxisomal N(1)-acetyl-spermine/spermidine oxidase [Hylaeus anthracinus]XP_053998474.1 peroxisomal N(1)-acetyl-spermine/spermidine oxidase [Hylaeus anthracinus]XP_053998476.1 peroxisomal N(1)-acetyl-spermine/spermidine oxidase [Hylae